MKLVAILLLIALLVMFVSPLFGPAPVALRAARSTQRLVAGMAALALLVISRRELVSRTWRRARNRAPAATPLFLRWVPVTDLDCVRLC